MNAEINNLKEQIAQKGIPATQLVDQLNKLTLLQLESDAATALITAGQAAAQAQQIGYKAGEAQALVNTGMCAASQRNYPQAQEWYKQALAAYTVLDNQEGIATAQAKLGNTYLFQGKYEEALQYYNNAITIRTRLGDELGVADLNTNSGIIYGFQGNYTLALKWHLQALKIFEHKNLPLRIASSSTNIGTIYLEQKNYEEALKMFDKALQIRRETNDTKGVSDQLNNIGNIYHEQGQLNQALEMHRQALQLREQLPDTLNIAYSYSNIGNIYKDLGKLLMAEDFYTQALSYFRDLKDQRGLVQSYVNLGELYVALKKYAQAHEYLDNAVTLAEETGLKNQLRQALKYLTEVYALEGRFEEAYKLHVRYTAADREISNTETSRQIAQMTLRYEIEQKERDAEAERIKNAELQKAYLSLEEEKHRSEELLLNILPEEISHELKLHGKTRARSFEMATVMFADIQGFTAISEKLSAEEIVSGIDEYFEAFDRIVEKHGVEKIKTIGDAYLCAGGVPVTAPNHAEQVVKCSIDFMQAIAALRQKRSLQGHYAFDFRIGIHSGPVVAGVVGIKKFAYDIWGDTVNTASRMQQNSLPHQINISESTYQLIKDKFTCTYRGELEAKNKGRLKMYFVNF